MVAQEVRGATSVHAYTIHYTSQRHNWLLDIRTCTMRKTSPFSALMLLAGQNEEVHPACESSTPTNVKSELQGIPPHLE